MLVVAGLQMSTTDIEFFLKSTVGSLRYSTHSTELVGTEYFFFQLIHNHQNAKTSYRQVLPLSPLWKMHSKKLQKPLWKILPPQPT